MVVTNWRLCNKSRLNGVARPLSIKDLKKLPKDLRPYMDYLCNNFEAELQSSIINRTKINIKRSLKFFKQIKWYSDQILLRK